MIHAFYWKFCSLSSGKRIENRLRFGKVTAMSLVAPLFWDTVYKISIIIILNLLSLLLLLTDLFFLFFVVIIIVMITLIRQKISE